MAGEREIGRALPIELCNILGRVFKDNTLSILYIFACTGIKSC